MRMTVSSIRGVVGFFFLEFFVIDGGADDISTYCTNFTQI